MSIPLTREEKSHSLHIAFHLDDEHSAIFAQIAPLPNVSNREGYYLVLHQEVNWIIGGRFCYNSSARRFSSCLCCPVVLVVLTIRVFGVLVDFFFWIALLLLLFYATSNNVSGICSSRHLTMSKWPLSRAKMRAVFPSSF
jgi:hypothetical protein